MVNADISLAIKQEKEIESALNALALVSDMDKAKQVLAVFTKQAPQQGYFSNHEYVLGRIIDRLKNESKT